MNLYFKPDWFKIMSISFPLQELKDAGETIKIKKLLTLIGESKEKKFYQGRNFYEKKTIVNMYMIENGMIYLPYTFAKNYFLAPKKINFWQKYFEPKEYPPLFKSGKEGRFKGVLRDYQVDAYKEAKKILKKHKTITLEFYPSFGKTFFGSVFSWYLNAYTVILVHRGTIAKAWFNTYQEFLDVKESEIIMVDNKINKKKKGESKTPAERGKIFICLEQRWKYIPEEIRKKIKLLIIDEAHTFCSPSKVNPLLFLQPEYIIALTATAERVDDGLETVIETICGTHSIIRESEKPFKFYVINTKVNIVVEGDKNKFGELVEKQTLNERRNEIILDLIQRHSHFKTMFIGKRKNHCCYLRDELTSKGLECATLFGNKKECENKNILIGTDSKMGTGFDESKAITNYDGSPSELLIIGHSYKKRSTFVQVAGRGFRSQNPKLVCFCDDNNTVKNHIRNMKIWVEELKGTVVVVKEKDISTLVITD